MAVSVYEKDAELVLTFQKLRCSEAFSELMRRHVPWVLSMCQRMVGGEAEDVCQEVFLQAYKDLPTLRDPMRFRAWLGSITRRKCYRTLRSRRETLVLEGYDQPVNPWSSVTGTLELVEALAELPPAQRIVVVLLAHGYGIRDIAHRLKIPEGTVKSRLYHARRNLRKFTNQEGESKVDPVVERIIAEVERRLDQFACSVTRPVEQSPELLDPQVRWWHERRQADAEANAALYGIEAPDVGPRMSRAKIRSGTLSRDGITHRHWGIPDNAQVVGDVRDLSRRLLVSPFTIWEWTRRGMPTLRYYPWRRYDINLVQRWLAENRVEVPKEVTLEEVDNITRFVLEAVRDGRGSVEDAEEILESM